MSADLEWLAEVIERAPQIAQAFADGVGEGATQLSEAGCPKGCQRCTRECAVRFIAADWWSRELAAVQTAGSGTVH